MYINSFGIDDDDDVDSNKCESDYSIKPYFFINNHNKSSKIHKHFRIIYNIYTDRAQTTNFNSFILIVSTSVSLK